MVIPEWAVETVAYVREKNERRERYNQNAILCIRARLRCAKAHRKVRSLPWRWLSRRARELDQRYWIEQERWAEASRMWMRELSKL